MTSRQCARIVARVATAALAAASLTLQAEAHGGRVQLGKVPAGPYLVSVWTLPDPARVGALDISLAIMEPRSERPLLDATARLTATQRADSGVTMAHGLEPGGGGNPILYHALLDVPSAGTWQISLSVQGSMGSGQVGFDLAVEPAPSPMWVLGPGIAVGLAFLGWMAAGRRRGRP